MIKNRDKQCKEVACGFNVYAKDLCRRHYKKMCGDKGGYKATYDKRKNDPAYILMKRESDRKYREKKKLGIDTTRKTDNDSLVNKDWQLYASQWTRKTNYLDRKSRKTQESYHKTRLEVLSHYSGGHPKCKNCDVEDERVLSIDHMNNDGNKHRKEINQLSVVWWVKKQGYPEGFQILCHNCNWLKELGVRKNKFDKLRDKEYKPLKKSVC